MNRAIIVSPPGDTAGQIEQAVRSEGFGMASVVTSGSEARRIIKSGSGTDLIVINAPLSDEFGHDLAETAAEESAAGIVFVCPGDIADEAQERLSDIGAAVVRKPIGRELLVNAIRLVGEVMSELRGPSPESAEILTKIDEMRLINRAKAALMKYLKFTEPQAHRYIEKQAMNNRQTRREVAEHILSTYEK